MVSRVSLNLELIKNYEELKKVCNEKELEQVFEELLKAKMSDPSLQEENIEFVDRINETLIFNDLLDEVSFRIYLKSLETA